MDTKPHGEARTMNCEAREVVKKYFAKEAIRKLHLGCGENVLEGWLNTDLVPRGGDVFYVDVRNPMPFDIEDGMFEFIFSEHMIEHLDYAEGTRMLEECYRVLIPGGRLRISTPDLAFLVGLYRLDKSDIQRKYIEWSTDTFIGAAPCYADTFVINNYVRDWGHTFIYDEKTLTYSLINAGFRDIVKCQLNESTNGTFQNLENSNRIPVEFLRLESIILEASKPASGQRQAEYGAKTGSQPGDDISKRSGKDRGFPQISIPFDLRSASTQDMLGWRDRIVSEAAAHMNNSRIREAMGILRTLELATTDELTLELTDGFLPKIAGDRQVVASFDPNRLPKSNEVIIIYNNYPHMFENVVVNNPIKRHVVDFWNFQHHRVEYDPRWEGVDRIFIINVDDRCDRYDAVLRELATAKAPFDRITRVAAVTANADRAAARHSACLQSHIQTLERARAAGYNNVLVLEDDFCFTGDLDRHLTDLAMFFERGYDYWICLVATSKYGAMKPRDDLVSLSFQVCTSTAGYLVSHDGLEQLLPVYNLALKELDTTGDFMSHAADRCWTVLQPSGKFLVFRRKFGFQVSSFSSIERSIARNMD